ncbi:tRNA-dihydrouridine synthase 2 [Lactifluus volemus]|nr:tRNA-dihydrouridine synthase 2 [Lactifluus volemus]
MSRRSPSSSPPRDVKRPRLAPLTPDDYRNGLMLAPMVRSGALPTRLFALKHGAKLVWGPEMVDKAILHAERIVDPVSGTISYNGKQERAMFTCHPIEKPYLIFQVGSANPELAVQAARVVLNDVSGVELNCGCPKPFSTHAGMGAALLTNPDLLCSILSALRRELPPHISVSAKIRLLPTQEDTFALVERIVETGINCLTIHCRTRNMRPRERALIHRLKEIVDFVRGLGRDVAVIENGDCVGLEDARRIRAITGADSVMIASAAEANPSVFSPTPLTNLEDDLILPYLRLCKYLDNHWASTKFCISQFKGRKSANKALREAVVKAKGYSDLDALVKPWTGSNVFSVIRAAIDARAMSPPVLIPADDFLTPPPPSVLPLAELTTTTTITPSGWRGNPDPTVIYDAPLLPANEHRMTIPAGVSKQDPGTPTPIPLSGPVPTALPVI